MKFIKIVSILLCSIMLINLSTITSGANGDSADWYIKKNKEGGVPEFPPDAEFIDSHSGYYIDTKAYDCGEKVLYLTFDAGYENGNIEKTLDILKDKKVPAAFFILKNLILKNTDLVKRMADEGHVVCNHTNNHKDMTTLTDEEMRANLSALEELYNEKIGYTMQKYFRFPEGRYNKDKMLLCEKNGYKTFFWSISHADWDNASQPNAERATANLLKQTHPGAIILLHPTSETNVRILPTLIDSWTEMGYRFGTLDELVSKV